MPKIDGGLDVWDSGPWVLADDFICVKTGPITDIHIWGSWLNDQVDPGATFWLGMYDDVPAVTNGPAVIPSRPGTNLLWQQYFGPAQYAQLLAGVGISQMMDPGPPSIIGPDSKTYYYCFYPTNPPVQLGTAAAPRIYWLAVYTIPSQGTANLFGWKTSFLQQFDISVHTPWPGVAPVTSAWQLTRDPSGAARDLAFKINTATNQTPPPPCCPETNGVKFLQRPNIINGHDVNASQSIVLADDFKCTNTGPIMDIRLWGSWLNDKIDPNTVFSLGIWSDVPAVTNAAGVTPSHPGVQLWSQPFGAGEYGMCLYTNVSEQFYDPSIPALLGPDTQIDYLCFFPTNPFVQRGTTSAPTNYWLSVNALTTAGAGSLFGWHTSFDSYNDIAVYGAAPSPAAWKPMYDLQGLPLSMAFKVTTATNPCPAPIITCPPNKTVECGTSWTVAAPTVVDPCCGTNYTIVSHAVTNGFCPSVITINWLVTDCNGLKDSCTSTVTIVDTTPPEITCVGDKTVECGSTWSFDPPAAFDSCCSNVTIFVVKTTTNGICPKTLIRTWAAMDCCGNTNTCSQAVTLLDTTPPSLQCASDKTVECGRPWTFDPPYAFDACCSNVVVNVLGTSTNGICPQFVVRTWIAFDCCGNSNTCSQTVTLVDTTPPGLTCATNKTVDCGSAWTFDPPIATDNCCSNVIVTVLGTFTNGYCPQVLTRTWVAKDCCGNSNSCSQTVTVINTTPPSLICPTNKLVQCGTPWTFDLPTVFAPCCGTNYTLLVLGTFTNGVSCDQVISRVWVAYDCCQRQTTTCTQRVEVVDTLPPSLVCPSNMVVDTCNTNARVTWTITATDTCSTNVTIVSTPPSGTVFDRGTSNLVHVVATDNCGNTATCDFSVLVERPLLAIFYNAVAHSVTLTWADGVLQEADSIFGPWTDLPLATSPYTTPAVNPQKFYRLRCP